MGFRDSYSLIITCDHCGAKNLNGMGTGAPEVLKKVRCGECGKTGFH